MNILKYLAAILLAYFLAWTVAYFGVFVSRGDGFEPEFFFSYMEFAWFSQGDGKLVGLMWLCSLSLLVPSAFS